MSIVSSNLVKGTEQIDGRLYVTETHVDSTGKEHIVSYLAEAGVDHNAVMTNRVPGLEQQLADEEFNRLVQ